MPARELFWQNVARVKIAHSSTSIEGNTLKEYQVAQVAERKKINAPAHEVKEVKNYLSALKKIDVVSQERKSFFIEDVLRIHAIVMAGLAQRGKIGVFRKTPVYVVNISRNKKEEVVYSPPHEKNVQELMKHLIGWLQVAGDTHPIIRAGLFHYQFETIHPFSDGNGRTGRLLALLHLYQSGWDFKKILVLEDYYNQNRKAYFLALQTGKTYEERQNADLTNWLEYYVKGFLEEVKKVKDQVMSLSALGSTSGTQGVLKKDELKIVDFVLTLGRIGSSDVVDILEVPKRTAQAKLKKLEERSVLKKVGAGPGTYYVIRDEAV